jgi:GxxExxY protein
MSPDDFTTQTPFPIAYKGHNVGTYSADLVVEDRLLVEVKCVEQFSTSIWLKASTT